MSGDVPGGSTGYDAEHLVHVATATAALVSRAAEGRGYGRAARKWQIFQPPGVGPGLTAQVLDRTRRVVRRKFSGADQRGASTITT
jgi:hypothetical protein